MDLKLKNNSLLSIANNTYIPIKYVESIGSPNIDIGVNFYYGTRNLKIDCVLEVVENSAAGSLIFSANVESCRTYLSCINADDTTSFSMRYYESTNYPETLFQATGKIHIIAYERYLNVNGTAYTLNAAGVARGTNLRLLPSDTVKVRIYSFKIYQSNTLIRNFVPAISYQQGHFGEACLYDTVNNVFYYSASIGSFSISGSIYNNIEKLFIQNCPNVSAINILRRSPNVTNVRCDIGTVYGPLSEVQHYATLHGFNNNEEPDNTTAPTINGTFTITDWYTEADLESLQGIINGLTIIGDNVHNVNALINEDVFAVQTLDSTKANYNPAVAILLNSGSTTANKGNTIQNPIVQGGGRWFMLKTDAATITNIGSIFVNATTVVDEDAIVSNDDTATYDFTSFDELKYFGVTILTNGFNGCSKLESVYTHNITSLTKNSNAFGNCSKLKNLYLDNLTPTTAYTNSIGNFGNTGDGTGIFLIKGPTALGNIMQNIGTNLNMKFRKIIFNGVYNNNFPQIDTSGYYNEFYIRYALKLNGTGFGAGSDSQFYDIGDVFTGGTIVSGAHSNTIVHLAYDGMACGYTSIAAANRWYKVSKVYVGSGSSRQNDENILALYLSNSDWATYSSKLATWYDYNGIHKWYYVTDNLTNCSNTNPDNWPHIARGESYQTTIKPYNGMTLSSVTVEMYEAVDNGTTPNTPTDITSSVYNSSTGEINIPSVTGNVIITASAS